MSSPNMRTDGERPARQERQLGDRTALESAVQGIREDLAVDEREHEEYGHPLGEWVEVRRADLAVILRHIEQGA